MSSTIYISNGSNLKRKDKSRYGSLGSIKLAYILLFLLMAMELGFVYLIAPNSSVAVNIVFIVNTFIFITELIYTNGLIIRSNLVNFVYLILLMVLFSSISGAVNYSQSFFSGLVAQREYVSWTLMVLFISSWLERGVVTTEGLKQVIVVFARFYAVVCIAQYLFPNVQFLQVDLSSRYGSNRFAFDTAYLSFASGLVLDQLFNASAKKEKPHSKLSSLATLAVFLFVIIIIAKVRMTTLALLAAIFVCIVLRNNIGVNYKYLLLITAGILLIALVSTTAMGKDILSVFGGDVKNYGADTLSIRTDEQSYFLGLISKSPFNLLFGMGTPNVNNPMIESILNPIWTGVQWTDAHLYPEDVGLLGCAVYHGLFGITILIYIYYKLYRRAWQLLKAKGESYSIQLLLFETISAITLFPSFFKPSFIFPLLLVLTLFECRTVACSGSQESENNNG